MFKIDMGYYYGLGAFETILVKSGQAIFLSEHLKRLSKSLAFFNIDKKVLSEEVTDYLAKEEVQDRILKICVSENNVNYSLREKSYTNQMYIRGFNLIFSSFLRNETSPLTYHKSLNYAENIIAKQFAQQNNRDEALLYL